MNNNRNCTACGAAGELAVIRLATGNLVLDALCRLHWPTAAMTPLAWAADGKVQCRVFPRACDMSRAELLCWLFSEAGRRPHLRAWVDALSELKEEADAYDF